VSPRKHPTRSGDTLGILFAGVSCDLVRRPAMRILTQSPVNIDVLRSSATLCDYMQVAMFRTPNAKVAGWTPARATTYLYINELFLDESPWVIEGSAISLSTLVQNRFPKCLRVFGVPDGIRTRVTAVKGPWRRVTLRYLRARMERQGPDRDGWNTLMGTLSEHGL
jgi:hypothetical protein